MSRLVQKTKKHRFWSIFDLDGTYAAGSLEARRKVRAWAEQRGALLFCTARTPELVMSPESFELSRQLAEFKRAMPLWAYNTGRYQHDPDAILAFGEGIYLAGVGCCDRGFAPYYLDRDYRDRYLDPAVDGKLVGRPWKEMTLEAVHALGFDHLLSVIDRPGAYERGEGNVLPAEYRVALESHGEGAVERVDEAQKQILDHVKGTPLELRLEGVDESKPHPDHSINRGTKYLMPPEARKENMINHGLVQTTRVAGMEPSLLKGLIAGDQMTDLVAICEAGFDADFTGILVDGPLTKVIQEKESSFAGTDMRRLHALLMPTGRPGYYHYDNPAVRGSTLDPHRSEGKSHRRTVVIGGIAYPGTVGADTLWAYIEDNREALAA